LLSKFRLNLDANEHEVDMNLIHSFAVVY